MEDRYEIRGKIGQGGLGSVYRGYDNRMNREVAIKRISPGNGDSELEEESTRQLIKEASALASLQHPHIVTVYDVGQDEDGPYVVMELLTGKPLDELIEKAPLTWSDFRELALQTQEALIAAQELDLIHSDIKPSNLMLSWLPSGKFQVKIVDFGLAVLTQSQSKEDLETMEAVFGSIFFMAPEQFERVPLDARADMYSMGCVYYQALTGVYPFDGKTGNDVMTAHLHHTVKPIEELRPDIPPWAASWVMWHINRYPQDRPENARESLSIFLQNDKLPTTSLGTAPAMDSPKRPRLIIPGSAPAPSQPAPPAETPKPAAASQPAAAPVESDVKAPAPMLRRAKPAEPPPAPEEPAEEIPVAAEAVIEPDPVDEPEAVKSQTSPQPLTPPEGSKPSVHTSSQAIPAPEPTPTAPAPATATRPVQTAAAPTGFAPRKKKKMSNATKTMIAAVLGLLVVLLGWILLNRSGQNRETRRYNELIAIAKQPDATEVPMNKADFEIMLRSATFTGALDAAKREVIYKALFLAKPTDGTDFDKSLAEIATTRDMLPEVRKTLLGPVLRKRGNPVIVPTLLDYVKSTATPEAAKAALEGIRFLVTDEHFDPLLQLIQTTESDDIRKAAEETAVELIDKSTNRAALADKLSKAYEGSVNDKSRHAMLRLLGRCGGAEALAIARNVLEKGEPKDQVAALMALRSWGDNSAFPLLADFLRNPVADPQLKAQAFDAALGFLSDEKRATDPGLENNWRELSVIATDSRQKELIIRNVVNREEPWAEEIVQGYLKDTDPRIQDVAEKALRYRSERQKKKDEE
ncbi:MAG: protein kinase [Akkermansiaceae bacterium]|nr:protein kinase [Akkermansiaceae bacterium]MCP5542782.1 protein kinase [Akkermansiaceae bacterium]